MRENDKLARALDLVDDDLIERAAPGAYRKKANKIPWYKGQWTRIAVAASLVLCLLGGVIAAVLSGSGDPTVPPVNPGLVDNEGEYSEIASKLQLLQSGDVTAFDSLFTPSASGGHSGLENLPGNGGDSASPSGGNLTTVTIGGEVVELGGGAAVSNIVQRTDSHIFSLSDGSLLVHSLAGENSTLVGEYSRSGEPKALFLSADGTRLVLITAEAVQVRVSLLNVSDPANITEISAFKATGRYCAARLTEGKLLLILGSSILGDPDYTDASTFVPQYDAGNGLTPIAATDIYYPEKLSSTEYTVLYQLNGGTLAMEDGVALLSYTGRIYLASDSAFVTRPFVQYREAEGRITAHAMLEIARIGLGDGKVEYKGSVSVEGIVKDGYSLNMHEGILRAVTTTREVLCSETVDGTVIQREPGYSSKTNVALFCVDPAQMKVTGSLLGFAAEGNGLLEVRFTGAEACVNTVGANAAGGGVFLLDTGDPSAITYHTADAMSGRDPTLLTLGNGYLLDVGKGEDGLLKMVVYRESTDGLTEVCAYSRTALFSEDTESYLIDPERGLIGLVVSNLNEAYGTEYILLQFDGESLNELLCESFNGFYKEARSFIAGGYVYVLSRGLKVFALELS